MSHLPGRVGQTAARIAVAKHAWVYVRRKATTAPSRSIRTPVVHSDRESRRAEPEVRVGVGRNRSSSPQAREMDHRGRCNGRVSGQRLAVFGVETQAFTYSLSSGKWKQTSPSLREGRRRGTSLRGGGLPGYTTMTENRPNPDDTTRTRSLRKSQTTSEGLLWSVLRAKQLCGLKFRRQHRIEPWIVDFACPQKMLVVEIDGGYHDNVVDDDLKRQKHLEALGWKVIHSLTRKWRTLLKRLPGRSRES